MEINSVCKNIFKRRERLMQGESRWERVQKILKVTFLFQLTKLCCSMLPFFRYKKHSPSNTFFERPLERSHMTLMLVVNNNDTIIWKTTCIQFRGKWDNSWCWREKEVAWHQRVARRGSTERFCLTMILLCPQIRFLEWL